MPVVLADTGLTFYNLNNIRVGENGYVAQIAWGAIGYSPAASYGVKLALDAAGQEQRRVVSVSGDGAFAESANAIGTIAELGLDNVVFVMVNGVFAIEQFLIKANAFKQPLGDPPFTALTQVRQSSLWNWKDVATGFGGVGYEVTTNAELAEVIEVLKAGSPPAATSTGPCADHVRTRDAATTRLVSPHLPALRRSPSSPSTTSARTFPPTPDGRSSSVLLQFGRARRSDGNVTHGGNRRVVDRSRHAVAVDLTGDRRSTGAPAPSVHHPRRRGCRCSFPFAPPGTSPP